MKILEAQNEERDTSTSYKSTSTHCSFTFIGLMAEYTVLQIPKTNALNSTNAEE